MSFPQSPLAENDNRFVEQKNDTLVRAYLGYKRMDTVEHTILLNQLYDLMWLYHNFFQPVMRLCEKIPLPSVDKRLRYKRRFDKAQTPFDRLCATRNLDPDIAAGLSSLRQQINPLALRKRIYEMIALLMELSEADGDQRQNVHLTTGMWKCGQQADTHSHMPDVDDLLSTLFEFLYPIEKEGIAQ